MKRTAWWLFGWLVALSSGVVRADEPRTISPDAFDAIFAKIVPQKGESPFWEIEWMLDLAAARAKAAAEGKPLLIWSGAGGAPVGAC